MIKWLWVFVIIVLIAIGRGQTQQAPNSLPGCQYNATPPTLTDKQAVSLQCDINGKLLLH